MFRMCHSPRGQEAGVLVVAGVTVRGDERQVVEPQVGADGERTDAEENQGTQRHRARGASSSSMKIKLDE
ncbi:hypothetical protein EYF80_031265 [Liparis tanakae]|uniref:Uncharacterized protein n=1 Tax=Liparis tanakae TaxID=230148 RepID=A0A4Z2H0P5_9TELE|nr:hypothetical protein EYF80_031265 [Liparis tanakae]